jgi:hypothetical protein
VVVVTVTPTKFDENNIKSLFICIVGLITQNILTPIIIVVGFAPG